MILNSSVSKIRKGTLAVMIMILLTACAPVEVATPDGDVINSVTTTFTETAIVTIIARETQTFTTMPSAISTVTPSLEGAEQGITNALGVDLYNLADAPGITGEIAKTYPEIQDVMENNFPITIKGEVGGAFTALVTDFIVYPVYETAPRLFDNVVIMEVELSYLDANQKEQQIYVPFYLYNEQTRTELMVGTAPQGQTVDRTIYSMQFYDDEGSMENWSNIFGLSLLTTEERGKKQIVSNEDNTGFLVDIDAIYPIAAYNQNLTSGWDFDLLGSNNPPYTEDDLSAFQLTGDPYTLPEINGKRYFWPLTNVSGSMFNILQDRVR